MKYRRTGNFILKFFLTEIIFFSCFNLACGQKIYGPGDSSIVLKMVKNMKDSLGINMKPDRALELADEALKIANQIDYEPSIAYLLNAKGSVYRVIGDRKKAIAFFTEALSVCDKNLSGGQQNTYKINVFGGQKAAVLSNLGGLYSDIGLYDKALECYEQQLDAARNSKAEQLVASAYKNMGIFFARIEYYEEARKYYLLALETYTKMDASKASVIARHVVALYDFLGLNSINLKNYKDARFYLNKSQQIADSLGEKDNAVTGNLGLMFEELKKPDSALYYYFKALGNAREYDNRFTEIGLLNNIGQLYYNLDRLEEGEKYMDSSLQMAQQAGSTDDIRDASNNLSALYAKKKDYKKAYEYSAIAQVARDSIRSEEKNRQFAQLAIKLETKDITDKNKLLQQQNELQRLRLQRKDLLIYGSVSMAVLCLALGLLLVRQSRLRADRQKLELEQKQLLAQINPHFIYNCLNSIQQFIVQKDVMNANKYLADFAMLMRQTLEHSKDEYISLRREIEYLENYLSFESLRFEDKFACSIICLPSLAQEAIEIPSMVIQPFVENAIRHGLYHLNGRKGELVIRFYEKEKSLICEVDDNGIGMEEARRIKERSVIKHASHGMELTRKRLALVSKMSGGDYTIAIHHKKDDSGKSIGTTIVIKFQLNK